MTKCFRNALFSVSRSSLWSATFGHRSLHLLGKARRPKKSYRATELEAGHQWPG